MSGCSECGGKDEGECGAIDIVYGEEEKDVEIEEEDDDEFL